ncbi:SRPBCC family protein [Micromonospora sp. RHAY321]|uniref:SRPBCC family protein n=1 Tax=Micromonospora sp. RHAY321 TaxID=2944807 RepID=UPI00207D6D88|nr:SRPBCC family protein [Micromonospora sp. RHAY321]MCO1596886.1 SRPBCC family protein [Micromonospora sp. RHAY321]
MSDLAIDLPSDREITLTRSFDAPRELVFAAHTQAEHLKRWWARGNPVDVEIDFREGGSYRCVEHADDGNDYAFRGEYREIVAPERIVQTFEFEGMPGQVAVETLVFTEHEGRTTLTSTTRFDTTAQRDGMVESGMAQGAAESYAALDRHLATLR